MKKLSQISDKISDDNYSYTGKGAFESIVTKYKDEIVLWLEDLIPLQKQIEFLDEKEDVEFQKRNYTRILTKLLPAEYTEFVSLNILLRDLTFIKEFYLSEESLIDIYDKLVLNKYLKYPGKSEKYVEFNIFEEFVTIYKNELNINNLDLIQNDKKEEKIFIDKPQIEDIKEEDLNMTENLEEKKEKTNWTNLLLGKK